VVHDHRAAAIGCQVSLRSGKLGCAVCSLQHGLWALIMTGAAAPPASQWKTTFRTSSCGALRKCGRWAGLLHTQKANRPRGAGGATDYVQTYQEAPQETSFGRKSTGHRISIAANPRSADLSPFASADCIVIAAFLAFWRATSCDAVSGSVFIASRLSSRVANTTTPTWMIQRPEMIAAASTRKLPAPPGRGCRLRNMGHTAHVRRCSFSTTDDLMSSSKEATSRQPLSTQPLRMGQHNWPIRRSHTAAHTRPR